MGELERNLTTVGGNLELFDEKPLELAGFRLGARAAIPVGRPKFDQWVAAMEFAAAAAVSSPYWWGDLMRYAEGRADWAERMSQALDASGFARQTLLNLTSICNRVEEPERRLAPSVAHADAVAHLPREEQTKFLELARSEGLNVRELRQEIRTSRRRKVIEGQAVLEGKYRVIYADPPWSYRDSAPPPIEGSLGKAARHYEGMPIAEIAALPVEAHAHADAVLLMWVTLPTMLQNPGPREVLEAWGFTYKSAWVWDKVLGNFGHYSHVTAEILTISTRGSCTPDIDANAIKSIQVIRRSPEHSEKPAEFRKLIEKHWTRGPYLELFGREPVSGWSVFGNDARLWGGDESR